MRVLLVTNMYPSHERPHWGAFVHSQVQSLEKLGVDITLYEIKGWRSSWNYARALRELPTVARRNRFQVVHAHYGLSGAAVVRVQDVPIVVSFCGDDLLGRTDEAGRITIKSRLLVRLSHVAARRADGVIVKSDEMRRRLPEIERVEVIPNGVDLSLFAPVSREDARRQLGWPASGSILLFAGSREEPRKNWPLACEVERRLQASGRDVRLVSMYDRPQHDVALAMNAADILLLPSYHEGSPNVVKEAMAVGLPVVAAPVGDCLERLQGCSPSVVVARNPEAFSDAAAAILSTVRRSNGRALVEPLELSRVASHVLAVYHRVLPGHSHLHEGAEVCV